MCRDRLRPIPGHDAGHVPGLTGGGCPPGTAGVSPAPLPGGAEDDAHPGTRASRPHHCPAQPWPTAPLGWNGNGAVPFIRTGHRCSRRLVGCPPATLRYRSASSSQEYGCGRDARVPGGVAGGAPADFPGGASGMSATGTERQRRRASLCALQTAPCPIPGRDVSHVPGWLGGECPPGNAGVPPAPFSRHSLGRLRRWDGTVTGPWLSFGLAIAVHAGWGTARRQPCATAPFPPAKNKVAGETPAFPGGRGRGARRFSRRGVGNFRHWDRPATAPSVSLRLANSPLPHSWA